MGLSLFHHRIRFDRNELAGSFGDIGTDFPLIIGMILTAGLDPAGVLVMFGSMQILTGLIYGIPMPVQPLKAMATIVITQKLSGNILYGGGLAIGIMMLMLTLTGTLEWIARIIPKTVVRGIQFGLGLQLSMLALKDYVPSESVLGFCLAGAAFLVAIFLLGNRRYPPAIFIIALGVLYAFIFKFKPDILVKNIGFTLPQFHVPTTSDILTGCVVLALPQLALSLGNSILATEQIVKDFFPAQKIGIRKIGATYSFMNLINPFFGGVPVCHGSGGIAGHHTFGARTGGSVVIYGLIYLVLGLFLSGIFKTVIQIFPKPILGVILIFEGIALMKLIKETTVAPAHFMIALMVGLTAVCLPYGYVVGLLAGTALCYLSDKKMIKF